MMTDSAARKSRVAHVAFTMYPVTDIKRAAAFYQDILGLDQAGLKSDFWIEYDVAGHTFGIGNFEQVGAPGSAQSLALEVPDLDGFLARLAAQNVAATAPHELPQCRISVVRDPDGNQIWLHEKKA